MNSEAVDTGYAAGRCEEELKKHPETQPYCGEEICELARETEFWQRACEELPPYAPVQVLACYNTQTRQWVWKPPKEIKAYCQELAKEDPGWELEQCFCCCWAREDLNAVGVAEEASRPISEIDKGDTVLSGRVVDDGLEWTPAAVGFSQGIEGEGAAETVQVAFADRHSLRVSPDQPLLLADGTLTTAAELAPGQSLMGVDGAAVAVRATERGGDGQVVHQIATGNDWDGSPDGHLIQANGVVLGDFTLLLHYPELVAATAEA